MRSGQRTVREQHSHEHRGVVSQTARHSTISTTANIYAHLTRRTAHQAVDAIAPPSTARSNTASTTRRQLTAWLGTATTLVALLPGAPVTADVIARGSILAKRTKNVVPFETVHPNTRSRNDTGVAARGGR